MSTGIWQINGTPTQEEVIHEALHKCNFDFDLLLPSLQKEGKTKIEVTFSDLSRYNSREAVRAHESIEVDGKKAHPQEREVEGRSRVLGLFYLPPYTEVVLDPFMESDPLLLQEVFLAEAAHAVDYHFLTAEHRRLITNSLHAQNLRPDADVRDGAEFFLDGHRCSWFDVGPYEWWVGEAFMETFIEVFAPSIPVTISLKHATEQYMIETIREGIFPKPAVEPEPEVAPTPEPSFPEPTPEPSEPVVEEPHAHLTPELEASIRRILDNKTCPVHLRTAAKNAGIQ